MQSADISSNNYTLVIEKVSDVVYSEGQVFNISLSINSIFPYEKQLLTNIKLEVKEENPYEINLKESANSEYVTLSLKINEILGDIILNYDNTKLTLDKSYYLVNTLEQVIVDTTNTFTIPQTSLKKGEIYEINFVKTSKDIIITLGEDIKNVL